MEMAWKFSPLLFMLLVCCISVKAAPEEMTECLQMLCEDVNTTRCHPCSGLSDAQLSRWRHYIDAILANWKERLHSKEYYLGRRETPHCCSVAKGGSCSLFYIKEPKVDPSRLYDLTYVNVHLFIFHRHLLTLFHTF